MKGFSKKLFCTLLTIGILSSILCVAASAVVVRSSNYLDSYIAGMTAESGGKIYVSAQVDAIINATKIGVSDVYLYESDDNVSYTCVEHYEYEEYPDMMGSGRHFNRDVVEYDGTPGKYYMACVYVYAGNNSGGDTRAYTTASVRAFR